MNSREVSDFKISPPLTLTFALLVAVILGGNGLLIWQSQIASLQTDRLTGVSQQLIAVLRLQQSLLAFHQRLDELAQSKDAPRLVSEADPLRSALLQQTQRTRNVLTHLPTESSVDPAFVPTLQAIEITLPSQLDAITALATAGDWGAVRLRLSNELKPVEALTSALVKSIDQDVSEELAVTVTNMRAVQRRILVIVPATAFLTFFVAAFFGWATTRRFILMRLEERVRERTRIARDLHDTLLQGFISASMQLHVAVDRLPEDSPAKPGFARVLELVGQVVEEGRNAVRGFRTIDGEAQDLGEAFSKVQREMSLKERIECRVIVEGQPRLLRPIIRDEIYSIGREALVNAFRHSRGTNIEVELEYSAGELRVSVRDDGSGIDPEVLQSGRDGHWGMSGMRERAERIGAKLKVSSRAGSGTEVELRVPSGVAFESSYSRSPAKWFAGLYR